MNGELSFEVSLSHVTKPLQVTAKLAKTGFRICGKLIMGSNSMVQEAGPWFARSLF